MESKNFLNYNLWLPSFAGRQGRRIGQPYLELVNKYAFCVKEFEKYVELGKDIFLEIGFGSGEIIVDQALKNTGGIFIGCEVYAKGIAKLVRNIEKLQISNIRIFCGDGRGVLSSLPDSVLETIFLLFPDPWPKRKHHKRRIVTQEFLNLSIKKLKSTGSLIIATDHAGYYEMIEREIKSNPNCSYKTFDDLSKFLLNYTKYQKKSNAVIGYFEIRTHLSSINKK